MATELFQEEQLGLFAPAPSHRITCRICELPTTANSMAVLLCAECIAKLDEMVQNVGDQLAAALAEEAKTYGDWYVVFDAAKSDAALMKRYELFSTVQWDTPNDPKVHRMYEATRGPSQEPLVCIVRLELAHKEAFERATNRRVWAKHAYAEIDAARAELALSAPSEKPTQEYIVPDGAAPKICKSCRKPIVWVMGARGGDMPLSLTTQHVVDGVKYARPHWHDCPQSKEWSNKQ